MTSSAPTDVSRELPVRPESATAARRFAEDALDRWGCAEMAELATLVVSELVTNAVLHSRSTRMTLRLRCADGTLVVEVEDEAGDLPVPTPRPPSAELTFGRGLALVEAVTTAWGARPTEEGKVVWAELEVPV